MKIRPYSTQGLGILPIALFVELDTVLILDCDYDDIAQHGAPDIIFHGRINDNAEMLRWVMPRLASIGQLSSIITHILFKRLPMTAKLYIPITFRELHKRLPLIVSRVEDEKSLKEGDIFILHAERIDQILGMRKIVLENTPCSVAVPTRMKDDVEICHMNGAYDVRFFEDKLNIYKEIKNGM